MNHKRRNIFIVVIIVLTLAYIGTYLYLRSNHVFIHRAGNYDFTTRQNRYVSSTHFIEPSQVINGPEILATVLSSPVLSDYDVNDESQIEEMEAQFDELLVEATEKAERAQRNRDRLFTLFRPLAFIETSIWKVIDSEPLES